MKDKLIQIDPLKPESKPVWRQRVEKYITSLKTDSQHVRSLVQAGFMLLILWIGYEFYLFVDSHQNGAAGGFLPRPPGVEGFLPISALISLKYWLVTGIFNDIHPSGLVIFLIILALGLFMKKSFCSWVCPVGLISESLWQLGQKIFKRNPEIPRWLDYPLRSLKYLLLIFFAEAILVGMNEWSLERFIYSPYNKVADIKMYLFFANIDSFALWTIGILMALSVVVKNFWCRYLCPYGALLGFVSFFSPLKVTRDAETCTDCRECTLVCPNRINVHKATRVISDECTACGLCVNACPIEDTLEFRVSKKSLKVPGWAMGLTIVLFFLLGSSIAHLSGKWQNGISDQEYNRRIKEINSPLYHHAQGEVPEYGKDD
jgi:polyferredoxin